MHACKPSSSKQHGSCALMRRARTLHPCDLLPQASAASGSSVSLAEGFAPMHELMGEDTASHALLGPVLELTPRALPSPPAFVASATQPAAPGIGASVISRLGLPSGQALAAAAPFGSPALQSAPIEQQPSDMEVDEVCHHLACSRTLCH